MCKRRCWFSCWAQDNSLWGAREGRSEQLCGR
jgi:hypothetical protein